MLETIDFDFRETVEAVIDLLGFNAQEKGLELVGLINPEIPTRVRGDSVRLRQILMNLIGNAIKFTAKGEVVVQVLPEEETAGQIRLRFMITDTGIGLTPEGRRQLFQPFCQADSSTTRKFGGTGLGLTISKRLVELMGGTIGVHSKSGQGNCFWFTARLGSQPSTTLPTQTLPGELENICIGLIDDNTTNRMLLHKYTSYWGMRSVQAENAEKALTALRVSALQGEPCHVALVDMDMPGMSGLDLAKAIKADPLLASIRLIQLNPLFSTVDKIDLLHQRYFAAHLKKPVRYTQLYQCLLNVMRRSDMTRSSITSRAPTSEPIKDTGHRLLLADDNFVNQKVAVRMLNTLGYQVDVVGNGHEAVEAMQHTTYAGILMDCQMPEMDGFEATREIRKREDPTQPLPIVAITANAMAGDREKCLEAGMNDFLSKPVKLDTLAEVLRKWLTQPSSTTHKEKETGWQKSDISVSSLQSLTATHAPPQHLDAATVKDLRELGGDEDPTFFHSVIDQFCHDSAIHLNEIHLAIREHKCTSLNKIAHAFKGS